MDNTQDVFKKACLIQLSSSVWQGTRQLDKSVIQQLGQSEWLRGRKFLVNPELLGPIKTAVHMGRNYIMERALPFPITSLYLIPKEYLEGVEEKMQMFKERFWDRVHAFEDQYELAREEAKQVLGKLFKESDYPAEISSKFRFEWRYMILDVPKKTSILSPEIYKREKEKFEAMMEETRQMATEALAQELGDIVNQLVTRLNDEEGKPKSIKSAMLNRIKDFIDVFDSRNLFEDEKLKEIVESARVIVGNISPYGLQYNQVMRKRIENDMRNLNETITAAIEDLPIRKLRMNEMKEAV